MFPIDADEPASHAAEDTHTSKAHQQAISTKTIPADAKCEETFGMIGDTYLRCGKPAVALVQHRGRREGPYFMCLEDGWHNCRNRNAALLVGEGALGDVKVESDK